jgi:putative endonuclease
MPDKSPCVYILASSPYGTLYIGVTSDLTKRVWQHKNALCDGFTKEYKVHKLVWFELHNRMNSAIEHEKCLKNWNRDWKIKLIERSNPDWHDLYFGL